MKSNRVKALILLSLFGLTTAAPPASAAASRTRQRTVAKRQARPARTVKKPVKKTRSRSAPKPVKRAAPPPAQVFVQGHENVFRGLDRNGSGFISREEWPGSKMAFDAVDKNNDGRISLAELRSRED